MARRNCPVPCPCTIFAARKAESPQRRKSRIVESWLAAALAVKQVDLA